MRSWSLCAMRKMLSRMTVVVGGTCCCLYAFANDLESAMGLPLPPTGATEVRITTGHSLGWPNRLVVLREQGGNISGEEWMAWPASTSIDLSTWCVDAPAERYGWRWCHEARRSTSPRALEHQYRSLPLAELSTLPPQPPSGTAPSEIPGRFCVVKDGDFIEVQVLVPERSNRVRYWSPHACCPWPACQVMLNVRELLRDMR